MLHHLERLGATNAAFTLNGFDDQERNLTLVKTDFQVLKFKFHACIMKQAFYLLHKQNFARDWQQESTFLQTFHSVSGCQTCMYKRDIKYTILVTNFQKSPSGGGFPPPAPLNLQ